MNRWLMLLWRIFTGRAVIVAKPVPEREARCTNCDNWSVMFVEPCEFCGCTGEAEYQRRRRQDGYV